MLERKLRRELNPARPAASEERIANSYVPSGAKREPSRPDFAISIYTESLLAGICNE
jgi:hypothetical protein